MEPMSNTESVLCAIQTETQTESDGRDLQSSRSMLAGGYY